MTTHLADAEFWVEQGRTAQSPEAQDIALKLAQIYSQLAAIEVQQQTAQLQSGVLALLGQATSQSAEAKPEGSSAAVMRSEEATITEFIEVNLGRIEKGAQEALAVSRLRSEFFGTPLVRYTRRYGHPDFVLAWVAAIRAVVGMHAPYLMTHSRDRELWDCLECVGGEWPCSTVRAIAGIFRDQPGWDEAWA